MAESDDGLNPQEDTCTVGIHAVPIPTLPSRKAPPAPRGQTVSKLELAPEEMSEAHAVTLEPLGPVVVPGSVKLTPRDDDGADDWSVKTTGGSIPVGQPKVRRLRSLLLLMAVVLSCVAIWTPEGLLGVAADTIGLMLTTDIAQARTEPGPNPLVGQLEVTSSPSGIELFVDDEPRGVTPANLVLSAGAHHVMLVSSTGSVRHRVRIRPGYRTLYAEAIFPGTLYVAAHVEAELRVGGETITPSPNSELTLAPGSYEIDLLHPDDGGRTTHTVEIFPGQVTTFDAGGN